ncbi:hypothetical protein N9B55_01560 [Vicingaceae bacterium]|nr:hypothetical protein [Vicingaceae bacterium]
MCKNPDKIIFCSCLDKIGNPLPSDKYKWALFKTTRKLTPRFETEYAEMFNNPIDAVARLRRLIKYYDSQAEEEQAEAEVDLYDSFNEQTAIIGTIEEPDYSEEESIPRITSFNSEFQKSLFDDVCEEINSRNCFDFEYTPQANDFLLVTNGEESLDLIFKYGEWNRWWGEMSDVQTTKGTDTVIEETNSRWTAGGLNQSYVNNHRNNYKLNQYEKEKKVLDDLKLESVTEINESYLDSETPNNYSNFSILYFFLLVIIIFMVVLYFS